jgi:hypothetical protein
MKIFIFAGFLLATTFLGAQETPQELNCYNKWSAKFEERGADRVEDGTYEDVIITNRQGAKAICYRGKAEVREGIVTRFYILLNDGTYEEFKRAWKNNSNVNVGIVNGISASMITTHNELINVLWPSKIRPKKGQPVVAAEPMED